jgi:hypothetical protein
MSLGIRDQPRGNLWVRVVDPATHKNCRQLAESCPLMDDSFIAA